MGIFSALSCNVSIVVAHVIQNIVVHHVFFTLARHILLLTRYHRVFNIISLGRKSGPRIQQQFRSDIQYSETGPTEQPIYPISVYPWYSHSMHEPRRAYRHGQ